MLNVRNAATESAREALKGDGHLRRAVSARPLRARGYLGVGCFGQASSVSLWTLIML